MLRTTRTQFGAAGDLVLQAQNVINKAAQNTTTTTTTTTQWETTEQAGLTTNGTGQIRGVYLQGNEAVRPIFAKWLEPFKDLGANTLTISNTGGTDHLAFDAVGVPGFQFIQDEIEYDTRTHHSNMDTYDHLIPEDLKQASTIVAAFVYNTAQRDEKLPRKELPKPRGESRAAF